MLSHRTILPGAHLFAAALIITSGLAAFCSHAQGNNPLQRTAWKTDTLIRGIIGRRITGDRARSEFTACVAALRGWKTGSDSAWIFPLEGYTARSIGGRGRGYQGAGGYNFFDGNGHRGHPAHDMFIRDRNGDAQEDARHAMVRVLSVTRALVVSVTSAWTPDSVDARGAALRGGVSIWTYDPSTRSLLYYAHLARCGVAVGDVLSRGQPIGEVGRSGINAAMPRSTTHLHFMALSIETGTPKPWDPLERLRGASAAPGTPRR